ncbi:hypothetical protein [Mammaliicoccus sciuri]|uniref:hypothetical protein n=1 Tax=Mammaliicoccus sciuri TaxID=1296 RepID=UPI0034DD97E2
MKNTVYIRTDLFDRVESYAKHNNRDVDEVIEEILDTYLAKPAAELEEILNDTKLKTDYQQFQKTLQTYMNEEIDTLASMSETDSALDTDFPMSKVFERLTTKHLFKSYLNVDLFTTFMKNKI